GWIGLVANAWTARQGAIWPQLAQARLDDVVVPVKQAKATLVLGAGRGEVRPGIWPAAMAAFAPVDRAVVGPQVHRKAQLACQVFQSALHQPCQTGIQKCCVP